MDTLLREAASAWLDRSPAAPPLEEFLSALDHHFVPVTVGRSRRRRTLLAVACTTILVAGVVALVTALTSPRGDQSPAGPSTSTHRHGKTPPSPTPTHSKSTVAKASSHFVHLSPAQQQAIIRAPHPYLAQHCASPIGFDDALTTNVAGRPVLIATADCRDATTGAPTDVAVYGREHGQLQQMYVLNSGKPRYRGGAEITEDYVSVHGSVATVHYGGFLGGEPVCCPSRSYHRVFRLGAQRSTHGPLVRDHNERILGPR